MQKKDKTICIDATLLREIIMTFWGPQSALLEMHIGRDHNIIRKITDEFNTWTKEQKNDRG